MFKIEHLSNAKSDLVKVAGEFVLDAPFAKVLLVNDDSGIAAPVFEALKTPGNEDFRLQCAGTLCEGLAEVSRKDVGAILLNLSLPDSQGRETFDKLFAVVPETPILILGEADREDVAMLAVKAGAQDYLMPSHLDAYSLSRALRNAIERKAIEDALYIEKERALVTLNSIGDAVLCTDVAGKVTYMNLVAETMTGWPRSEAIGKPLREVFRIIDGATRAAARDPLEMAVEQNRTVGLTVNCVLVRRDGFESAIEDSAAPIHDRSGRIIGAVIVFHDVSAARAMAMQMAYSAQHDLVTNLPNRLLLNDRISQAISLAERQKSLVGVLFLDLDNFKYINDTLGHAVGDGLLKSLANKLVSTLRASDTVSRQGGDEFVVLLSSIDSRDSAKESATRILRALNEPQIVEEQTLSITGSLGISVYPDDGRDTETLLKHADVAMYEAKDKGRNNFQFFKSQMTEKALERRTVENSLRHALEQEEFVLHYQPKIELKTGTITGVEALIRWRRPGQGIASPTSFVPVAEECGLIVTIGKWVLREACRQGQEWRSLGLPGLSVAVNVSAVEFSDPGFVDGVRATLAQTGFEAGNLEIELTEGVLMKDVPVAAAVLLELKRMGVRLTIDDFGTGYSSLSYLQEFPIDSLKIDRSFVQKISAVPNDSLLVDAIIKLAGSLKLVVVAEGIETEEQRLYLLSLDCAEGQGFLFSHPVPAEELTEVLLQSAQTAA